MDNQKDYDVVIVGAGISGAIIASELTKQGHSVLILEAGEPSFEWPEYAKRIDNFYQAPIKYPNAPYPTNPKAPQPNVIDLENIDGAPKDKGYFVQNGPMAFASTYTRTQGGTTLHWLGTCLRMLPDDFKLKQNFGQGRDWPISYEDLVPYYEKAEYEIGVSADVNEQAYLGVTFNEDYVYPMHKIPQSYSDKFYLKHFNDFKAYYDKFTYDVSLTSTPQGRNSMPNAKAKNPASDEPYTPTGAVGYSDLGQRCEGNTSCVPICPVQAKYNALKSLQKSAQHSGSFEMKTRCVVSKLNYNPCDEAGEIDSIEYKEYVSMDNPYFETKTVKAKIYVLATHTVENAKLLLMSGIKSTSGLVGKNLMDHPSLVTWGLAPEPVYPFRGPLSTSGIESMRTGEFRHQHSAFRVDVGNDGWSWANGAPYSTMDQMIDDDKLFGDALLTAVKDQIPRQLRFGFLIEQTAQESNRVELSKDKKDALGNPVPEIYYNYSPYEMDAFAAAKNISDQIFAHCSVLDETQYDSPELQVNLFEWKNKEYWVTGAGHLAGTHIMGTDKHNSVVNDKQRSWDFDNLYLAGCGSMPSMGTSNPTLTMAALSFRTAEDIDKRLK